MQKSKRLKSSEKGRMGSLSNLYSQFKKVRKQFGTAQEGILSKQIRTEGVFAGKRQKPFHAHIQHANK